MDAFAQLSGSQVCAAGSQREWATENFDTRVHLSPLQLSSVGGVHCVDVAVQLVSKRQPGLGGEIYLGAATQASCSLAVATPGCRGGQTGLHVLNGN